jgi:hypothetical protein
MGLEIEDHLDESTTKSKKANTYEWCFKLVDRTVGSPV